MNDLIPLETLLDEDRSPAMPLPVELAALYGHIGFPLTSERPYVYSNFVSTLDGVVALGEPGQSGGSEISGQSRHDKAVMGILRAAADAVVVGAGTLRAVPRQIWAAEYIYRPLADNFRRLREEQGKPPTPLNVIVTGSGQIDLTLPVFSSGKVRTLVVTTDGGAELLRSQPLPESTTLAVRGEEGGLSAEAILDAIAEVGAIGTILLEGGPRLMGDFMREELLDEMFLTLAPQVAGRAGSVDRPGFVMDALFAPERPQWGKLISVKRAESHLFLRYSLKARS